MKFKITQQGKPIVSPQAPFIVAQGKKFVALEIDMRSKWCEVDATSAAGINGAIEIHIGTTDRSCFLDDSQECPWTTIQFPNHGCDEWDIFTAECCRYTLRVVLTKRPHSASA